MASRRAAGGERRGGKKSMPRTERVLRVPPGAELHIRHTRERGAVVVRIEITRAPAAAGSPKLTCRQREVAKLLTETGLAQKEIAAQLGITLGSVRTHVMAIYRRLGVQSRPGLTAVLRGDAG